MGLLAEFKEFTKSILSWIYLFLGFSFFFFIFGLKEIELFGKNLFLPLPTLHSFSTQFFEMMQKDLLPSGVRLIITEPLSAFLAQMTAALLAGFLITFPFLLYKIAAYLSPALYENEKKALLKVLLPSFGLFIAGCLFGYFVLIPPTFKILYSYGAAIEAIPYFSVNEFIRAVFSLTLVTGILFLLPVFMLLLSSLGIVEASFWKKNWRYALLVFLIFSAIITPDGSGITMVLLTLPLSALYGMGIVFSNQKSNTELPKEAKVKKRTKSSSPIRYQKYISKIKDI